MHFNPRPIGALKLSCVERPFYRNFLLEQNAKLYKIEYRVTGFFPLGVVLRLVKTRRKKITTMNKDFVDRIVDFQPSII